MAHKTNSGMVAFLYELLRDHVTLGVVEKIVREQEESDWATYMLSNEYLAQYCEDLVSRINDTGCDE